MNGRTIGYWGATLLFCLVMVGGGVADIVLAEPVKETLVRLGYPSYLGPLLGVFKLLGVAALLIPGFPILKEWAYAGFTFDLIGAFVSHLAAGDPGGEAFPPVAILGIMLASYLLRPESRRPAPALNEPPLPASVSVAPKG